MTPVIANALDREALLRATSHVTADAVVHQLTSLTSPPARHGDMAQNQPTADAGDKNLVEPAGVPWVPPRSSRSPSSGAKAESDT